MFRSLYAKLMVTFLAILLVAMALLSVLLYQRIRADKIDARLSELTMQADDLAMLTGQVYTRADSSAQRFLLFKVDRIMRDFDAAIIIIDRYGKIQSVGDEQFEIVSDFMQEESIELLASVLSGKDIALRTTDQETGNPVFTIGVPFFSAGNEVLGGVFIHTSVQSVEASYRDVIIGAFRAMIIALSIGSVLILLVCQYISQPLRAMAQAADRFARGDFERRVQVRSRDEVGRLAEALNSMAAALDRLEMTRREFVANVSHELRSPLTSIQGFVGGMLDGTVPEQDREKYLDIVLCESKRLSKLINTLLDLSRIESGQTPLQKAPFDINEMIARVMLRQEAAITERGMDVTLDFEEDACTVLADGDRIEQVLVNLIDNAMKFTKTSISVTTRREREGVRVIVLDDGPGIAPEDLPFVLDRFYTADKAHTTGAGSGLGLSIAKSILEQHGRTLSISSEPGNGAAFSFTLGAA